MGILEIFQAKNNEINGINIKQSPKINTLQE